VRTGHDGLRDRPGTFLRLALAATALLAHGALPAAGTAAPFVQEADSTSEPGDTIPGADERPFVEGGVYDKPYLNRLFGRTAIGGYAEAHARFRRQEGITEEARFLLRRWNLFTSTQVSDLVRIGAEVEFEDGAEEILLEYAAVDLLFHPSFNVRAGAILVPLGRFNLSHDSPQNPFTDRPLVSTEVVGVALTQPGLGAFGSVGLGGDARLTYEVYGVNGFDEGILTDSPEGIRIPEGNQVAEDANSSPAVVGRLAFSPALDHEVGFSAHRGRYNEFRLDGEEVEEPRDLTLLAVDLETRLFGVTVMGEAVRAEIEVPPALQGLFASEQWGFYVEATRPLLQGKLPGLPEGFISPKARIDYVDFDADGTGDDVFQGSVGLNLRPTPDTAIKLEYVRGRERDPFNNGEAFGGILFSVATYF